MSATAGFGTVGAGETVGGNVKAGERVTLGGVGFGVIVGNDVVAPMVGLHDPVGANEAVGGKDELVPDELTVAETDGIRVVPGGRGEDVASRLFDGAALKID